MFLSMKEYKHILTNMEELRARLENQYKQEVYVSCQLYIEEKGIDLYRASFYIHDYSYDVVDSYTAKELLDDIVAIECALCEYFNMELY